MRLLIADETNSNPDASDFFIYGGVHFDMDHVADLDRKIEELRLEYGYKPGDDLKWNGKPDGVTPEQHAELKANLIRLADDYGAEFIPVMVHYDLIADEDGPFQWWTCMRDLLSQYHYQLECELGGENGVAVLDHIPEGGVETEKQMLENIFSHGTDYNDLDYIKMMSVTYSNASHLSSLTDVILGAFQFCINKPWNAKAPSIFLSVARITKGWNGDTFDYEYGVLMRPKDPGDYGGRNANYEIPYEEMKNTMDGLLHKAV
jgi:hypothetical protein